MADTFLTRRGAEQVRLHANGRTVSLLSYPNEGRGFVERERQLDPLDVETLQALEAVLLDFPGCAVVISQDRWFLDRLATHVLAFEGDFEACEEDKKRRLAPTA